MLRGGDPATIAAAESHRIGLFTRRPSSSAVRSLVDFHVPHSRPTDVVSDQGFDFEELQKTIAGQWKLKWVETYSFLGNLPEHTLSHSWKDRTAELRRRFPLDGAVFCCVWRRA